MENQLKFLEEAIVKLPSPIDSEKIRSYMPKSICQMAPYPTDTPENFDTIDYFLQLSSETLFFIFYYLEVKFFTHIKYFFFFRVLELNYTQLGP